ncbi:hypothetical protein DHEL01_v204187 [Diaporthe helianthi]|uniref:Uncharacterized protein n=1 Tax=Diaporthe helianthi TaxID=158607 RepID=A0A2P5I4J2_DIAHE|nr:hypothetical protein DHEL01_v204187 [Diaporthe helianthi]
MALPKLTNTPTRHPDLCLSISTKLLQTLTTILTNTNGGPVTADNFILSVGSGSGMLEAHLQQHLNALPRPWSTCFTVKGVEVSSATLKPMNKYLPASQALSVRGTWEVCPFVAAADTLMFVYPRDPGLVNQYLKPKAGAPHPLRVVLWLGPRADWDVFGGCFRDVEGFGEVEVMEGEAGAGVAEFEMVAVLRRR